MSIATQLGNGFALRENQPDYSSKETTHTLISGDNYHLTIGNTAQAVAILRAALTALGEPVEAKPEPDRSELDRAQSLRYAAIAGGRLIERWHHDVPIEQVVQSAKGYTQEPFSVYELVAYVGPKPEPAERKVVRL